MIVSCSEDTQSAGTTTAASSDGKGAAAAESPSADTIKGTHRVLRVVDGDTVDVQYQGTTRLRLIGIDTPETVHPNKPVECGGPQASRAAEKLLDGKKITLAFNPEGDRIDKYDRALAYIQLRGDHAQTRSRRPVLCRRPPAKRCLPHSARKSANTRPGKVGPLLIIKEANVETTDTALYGGRNLTGYRADNGDEHCGWPEVAAEATRAMAHLTRAPTSAKVAYETVGHMSHIPQTMAQTLTQIADGLRAPDRDSHTASFLLEAREALFEAAQRCRDAGLTLEEAHNAMAHVGVNTHTGSR